MNPSEQPPTGPAKSRMPALASVTGPYPLSKPVQILLLIMNFLQSVRTIAASKLMRLDGAPREKLFVSTLKFCRSDADNPEKNSPRPTQFDTTTPSVKVIDARLGG